MFELIKSSENIVAMRIGGKLSGPDAIASKVALDDALQRQGKLGLVIDLSALTDISAEGLASGVMADLDMLAHIDRFTRMAFVSDKEWPAVVLGLMDNLISAPQMKSFVVADLDAALKWASLPVDTKGSQGNGAGPSLSLIRSDKPEVIGFEINGSVDAKVVDLLMNEMNDFLALKGKLRMLMRIKHLGGFDPSVFMQSGLLSMKFAAIEKLERYAIVGAPGWLATAVDAMNPLLSQLEMRHFAASQETEAWDWLGAKPAN